MVQAPGLVITPTVVQVIKNPHQRDATSLFPTRMFFNQLNRACHGIIKLASVIQVNTPYWFNCFAMALHFLKQNYLKVHCAVYARYCVGTNSVCDFIKGTFIG